MKIVGIDPSSKWFAATSYDTVTGETDVTKIALRRKASDTYSPAVAARAEIVCWQYMEPLIDAPIKHCYVEMPVMGVGIKATIVQSYINGIIQASFIRAGFTVTIVQNKHWKLEVTGHGNASKEQTQRSLRALWPEAARLAGKDDDKADSAAICWYGRIQNSRRRKLDEFSELSGIDTPVLQPTRPWPRMQRRMSRGKKRAR